MPDPRTDRLTEDLSAYLDGELSPERTAEVERALAETSAARQLLDELRAVSRRVGALPRVSAPADFADTMRSAAERWALLQRPARPRGRLLLLFARVSAAAAMIALAAFVTWQALDQSDLPRRSAVAEADRGTSPPADHTHRLAAPPAPAPEEERFVAGADADELGKAAPGWLALAPEPVLATEVAIAPPIAVPDFVSVDAPGEPVALADAAAPDVPASVDVVIMPQTGAEYVATYAVLQRWEAAQSETDRGAPRDATEADAAVKTLPDKDTGYMARAEGTPRTDAVQIVMQIPVANLAGLMQRLERQAGGRVRVEMRKSDLAVLRRIAATTTQRAGDAPLGATGDQPAKSAEPPATAAGQPAAGGVGAGAPTPAAGAPARTEAKARARGGERGESTAPRKDASPTSPTRRKPVPPATRPGAASRPDTPKAGRTAGAASQPTLAPAEKRGAAPVALPTADLAAAIEDLGADTVLAVLRLFADEQAPADDETATDDARAVQFRVTILPPPASQPTTDAAPTEPTR